MLEMRDDIKNLPIKLHRYVGDSACILFGVTDMEADILEGKWSQATWTDLPSEEHAKEVVSRWNQHNQLTAERDALEREVDENTGVIAVWRGRTLRAEAERDKLRAACETVLAWYDRNFDHTGDEDDVATLKTVREALNPQPEN